MSVFNYRRFKVSVSEESKRVQGLQTGDIVRRQYYDGTNIVYTLMLVLSSGVEQVVNEDLQTVSRPYFIGALLEGDVPSSSQVLDFVRVTNLFNEERLGALYLTASDSQAPYMDVIDGIGKNKSLSWPTGIGNGQYQAHNSFTSLSYSSVEGERRRVVAVEAESDYYGPTGLKINFTQYVANPNRVIVSYWIKKIGDESSRITVSLDYSNGVRSDGTSSYTLDGGEWIYKSHAFTVDYSGRHLRSFLLINEGGDGKIEVSDLNIILLSSVSSLSDASQIRWGKLDGIVDSVYGKLSGYGGYAQRLFIAGSAHVTGTLTAGDENGFGATFYAGKIHRNNFVNSLEPSFITTSQEASTEVSNPTGLGNVYKITSLFKVGAETRIWARSNKQKEYTLSFWVYAKAPCAIEVAQDGFSEPIGTINLLDEDLQAWRRCSITYYVEVNSQLTNLTPYSLSFTPTFGVSTDDIISGATTENVLYFSAPQLELGSEATQYQATDDVLEDTNDYGAWFSRGGIGGTIQNPLLKLNYDGSGSIGTRTGSFLLRTDGSGYFANGNIGWDETGKVTFGENVTLNWDNLSSDAKESIKAKSIAISGEDTIVVVRGALSGQDAYTPQQLTLKADCYGFSASSAAIQWQYYNSESGEWANIAGKTSTIIEVLPTASYWDAGSNSVNVRCKAVVGDSECYACMSLKKIFVDGYSVEIVSQKGGSFKNGECKTTLTANIYFRGKLITDAEELKGFSFMWHKYALPDTVNEVEDWWEDQSIDRTARSITLDYILDGQDYYTCVVATTNMFTYTFPITF